MDLRRCKHESMWADMSPLMYVSTRTKQLLQRQERGYGTRGKQNVPKQGRCRWLAATCLG